MRGRPRRLVLTLALAALVPMLQPSASMQQAAATRRPIELADIVSWKAIGATAVSNDGQWFAYRIAPGEGDAQVVVRRVRGDGKEWKFDVGELPTAGAGGGRGGDAAGGGAQPALDFSEDSKWIAFTTYPARREAQRLRRQRRPVQGSATIVDLASGEKREYTRIRRFVFSGNASTWIALQRQAPQAPAAGPAAGAEGRGGAPAGAGPGGGAAAERPRGTDLILRELATGQELNVGNVADFAFSRDGSMLAWTIDAQEKVGNGVQLRDMKRGTVTVLDSGAATYERLAWTEKGDGLAVLKGADDRALRDKRYAVLGFTALASGSAQKVVYDPASDKSFPEGMTISGNRTPQWTDNLDALLFGIHTPRKRDGAAEPNDTENAAGSGDEAQRPAGAQAEAPDADEKVDLVLWHWLDKRLQSQQEVQEAGDRSFSYLAEYRVEPKKFIRLADEDVRTVNVAPKQRFAIGQDDREYELLGNLDGRRFQDIYVIDMQTGERTLALKRARWFSGPSPDGKSFLYYDDGHYRVYAMESGQSRSITQAAPISFVDTEDDHNVIKPPAGTIGWSKDSASVLLTDTWDIWQVPVAGGQVTNLTLNGRKDQIRYQRRFALEPPQERNQGVDLGRPQYFAAYGEWTKKAGIARVTPGKPGVEMLTWSDAAFATLLKAKDADHYIFTKSTATEPNDYYASDASLKTAERLTDQRPQVSDYTWTEGSMLVNYTSDKGDKLQAALFLPAGYEKGKSYPTIVNIYEKMSQGANQFAAPGANGFNRSVYTSNGYAVLLPDITYKVNDPGMSAVWCVVPALKAAIATGVVDPKKVGLTGHSWGGYQTSFLVTQTDMFAAAVAGAPLTNMVSMYSLIYKNTGGTNQAIFESSQGRFRGGYWDNWDAYYRNSPVFFAKNVKTPLMILHNDRDGAVDFTQGVEYYNTLRRLQKPVIMLEYVGENHGLRKPANQRDYTVRMKEYFDHYLKGAPAPDWLSKGVPRLKMEEHLKERAKPAPAKKAITTTDTGR
ncbi:MAG TPA: prolyl oligopeptidase family serine peptidase [Vicinamibacterales bacterium]|nr:prolyl oligopeptidase family serine peptidase [Vicinamibacterales bacterium]